MNKVYVVYYRDFEDDEFVCSASTCINATMKKIVGFFENRVHSWEDKYAYYEVYNAETGDRILDSDATLDKWIEDYRESKGLPRYG